MTISVCVPARNEERSLPLLLNSLLAQSRLPDEIVVADGGSTDATVAVAKAAADRGVRVIEIGAAFPGRGRNEAVRAARYAWIAFIDAGCVADPRWLESLLAARPAGVETPAVVLGNYAPRLDTEWDVAQALSLVPPVDPPTRCRPPFIASSLVHRAAWERVGGFPEELRAAEDLLFFERIAAAGIPTARAPEARIEWSLAPSPAAVFRRLRLYSAYHIAAGLGRTWHRRVMTMDLALLALVAIGLLWWPALGLAAIAAATRLVKTVAERRGNVGERLAFRPDRLARVTLLLFLADAATWAGFLDWRLGRVPAR